MKKIEPNHGVSPLKKSDDLIKSMLLKNIKNFKKSQMKMNESYEKMGRKSHLLPETAEFLEVPIDEYISFHPQLIRNN